MDFLDSLDLESSHIKSNRVRSWYLYEQYKSLERNQKAAVEHLKDRTYQNQILYQELCERRARRQLYDQLDSIPSEPSFDGMESECVSVSQNDFLDCLCEDDDNEFIEHESVSDIETEHSFSQDDSGACRPEDFKSIEDIDECESISVKSMISNHKFDHNLADDIKKEIQFVKNNIAENLSLQLDTVRSNIECIEKYHEFCDGEKFTEKYEIDEENYDKCSETSESRDMTQYSEKSIGDDIICSKYDDDEISADYCLNKSETNIENYGNMISLWSKLVSFAYQVTQLNHGNCYYDYSSQLLTAVLACDVLRKSVHRIFDILQPYVSPIKFATDPAKPSEINKLTYEHVDIKCCVKEKKSLKIIDDKLCLHRKVKKRDRNYSSVKKCPSQVRTTFKRGCYSVGNYPDYSRDVSRRKTNQRYTCFCEPWGGQVNLNDSSASPNSISEDYNSCPARVTNPMLKLVPYFDSIIDT